MALIISSLAGFLVIVLIGIGLCIYWKQKKEKYYGNDTSGNKTPTSTSLNSRSLTASFSGSDVEYVIHEPILNEYFDVNKIYENACYKI